MSRIIFMKKRSIYLLAALFFLSACSVPNIPEPFSNIPSPLPLSIGKKVKKSYFTGGQIQSKFIMSDNTGQNGLLKRYGYNGKITSTVTIQNGMMHGIETLFDAEGRILKKTPYFKGKKEGTETIFYPNGDTMVQINYVNGVRHGKAAKYNKDGSINQEVIFENGNLIE